jgi:transcriptional regulator with XRE-family HTH domain
MKAGALVARNIRRLRVAKGLSQEVLAVDAEIDRTYVSRLERGLDNPTVAVLEKLARALSASIEDLFRVPRAGRATGETLGIARMKVAQFLQICRAYHVEDGAG